MFCSVYSVSLCCSVYCLCVNVYCTTATGCQPNCSLTNISYHIVSYRIIYHIISYHNISTNLLHVMYRKINRQNSTYIASYLFFILCVEYHVVRMQIKFCRSFVQHSKGRAGLIQIHVCGGYPTSVERCCLLYRQ